MTQLTQKQTVIRALKRGTVVNKTYADRNYIGNLRTVVARLREDGHPIYTQRDNAGNFQYVLGEPSAQMVRVAYRYGGADLFSA